MRFSKILSVALAISLALPAQVLAGGFSGGDLQSAYTAGPTVTERNSTPVTLQSIAADNANVLVLTKNPVGAQSGAGLLATMGATTTGSALDLTMTAGASGNAITVANNGSGNALRIVNAGGNAVDVVGTTGSTFGVNVFMQSGAAGSAGVFTNNATNNLDSVAVTKNPAGPQAGDGVSSFMGLNSTGSAFSASVSGTGKGISLVMSAGTTGGGLNITESGTGFAISTSGSGTCQFVDSAANNFTVLGVQKTPAAAQGGNGITVTMNSHCTGNGISVSTANGATGASLSLFGTSTSQFLESTDGSTSAVSGAATGRLRYNNGTGTWQVSTQAGAWASISTGGTTLQAAYNGGNTIAEAGGLAVAISSTTADNGGVLTVTKNPVGAQSGTGLAVSMGATTTGGAFTITQTAGFTGSAITVVQGANTVLQLDQLGTLSSPYNGNLQSEHFGSGSQAAGGDTAVGFSCNVTGAFDASYGSTSGVTNANNCAVIGYGSNSGSNSCTISGANSVTALGNASPNVTIAGQGCNGSFSDGILLGVGVTNTAAHQLVAGSATSTITDVWVGNGVAGAAPASYWLGQVDWKEKAAPALSAAGHSVIYMDSTTHTLLASQNGGAYAALGGGGGTLQAAYNGGNAIVEAGALPVAISSTTADNAAVLTLTKNPVGAQSGEGVAVTMGANTTGPGVRVTHSGGGRGVQVDYSGTDLGIFDNYSGTGQPFGCQSTSTSAFGSFFTDNGANNADVLDLTKNPVGAQSGVGLLVTMGATTTGNGITVTHNGTAGIAIRGESAGTSAQPAGAFINSGTNGADVLAVNMSSVAGAGNGIVVTNNGPQTGAMLVLTGGTMTANTGPILTGTQTWNNAGVTFTAAKINVTSTASAAASLLLDLQVGGVSKFNVDKSGNVAVLGKLTVTGAIDPPSVSLSSGTALFFDSADGSTAGLSAAGHGRIRYLNGTGWQVSSNGGAYASLSTGGALTFAQVLANGNTAGANDLYMSYQHQMGLGAFSTDTFQTYGSGDIATVNICENANGHRGINVMTSDATRPSLQVYVSSSGRFDGQNTNPSTVIDAGGIGLGSRILGASSGADAFLTRSATGVLTVGTTLGGTDGTLLATSLGSATTGVGKLYVDYQNNTSATTGNTTINKAAGRFWIAATGSTVTITDSFVTAKSHVFVSPSSDPGVAVAVESVVPSGTGFVVTLTGTVTNTTSFDFFVVNAD